jgi:PIN domain nuclease of toxin-antitoxin system
MAAEAILDSSAVLAVLFDEPGADRVLAVRSALVCAVNHAEIIGKLIDWGADDVTLSLSLARITYLVEPLGAPRASSAARLRRSLEARSLSLGDRACIALALETRLPVLTADRAWSKLELGIDVRVIR